MTESEVTIEFDGKQYGATYTVRSGILHVKTHTEVRSLEIGNEEPAALARRALKEIVEAQTRK